MNESMSIWSWSWYSIWCLLMIVIILLRHRYVRLYEQRAPHGTIITVANEYIRHIHVDGHMTYIRGITPTSAPLCTHDGRQLFYIIFPGNPGSADFYTPFMRYLSLLTASRLHIQCISHLGHSASSGNDGRIYTLAEQVNHKVLYIRQLLATNPNISIILAGHSIGAYFCLQVLKAIPEYQFINTHLLFPTIMDMGKSPNGRRQSVFYGWPFRPLLASVAWCLSLLPIAPSLSLAAYYVRSMGASKHLTNNSTIDDDDANSNSDSNGHINGNRSMDTKDLYELARRVQPYGHIDQHGNSNSNGNGNSGGRHGIWRSEHNTAIAVISLMRASIATNALSMAREEMRDIGDINTSAWRGDIIMATHHMRIRAIWSSHDLWAPLSYIDRLLSSLSLALPNTNDNHENGKSSSNGSNGIWSGLYRDVDGLPHAFVVDDRASQLVARRCHIWLQSLPLSH